MEEQREYTLLEQWRGTAYSAELSQKDSDRLWSNYFTYEKGIYEQILANPDEVVTGTVKGLAEKYGVDLFIMVGFLDGIDDDFIAPLPDTVNVPFLKVVLTAATTL